MAKRCVAGDLVCGRFRVEEEIQDGEGRDAIVYKAYDQVAREVVALKVAKFADSFALRKQHGVLRRVRTDSLVKVFGLFTEGEGDDARYVLTLELVNGIPLRDWVQGKSNFDRLEAMTRVTEALAELHRQNQQHRDLHTGNVLVEEDPLRIILIDPNGAETGWTGRSHSSSSSVSDVDADDVPRLADLFDDVAETFVPVATQLARSLRSASPPELSTVLATLRAEKQRPVVLSARMEIETLAQWTGADESRRHDLYRQIQEARRNAIQLLFNSILSDASRFPNIKTRDTTPSNGLEQERISLHGERGYFAERSLQLRTMDGRTWTVTFKAIDSFEKPHADEDDATWLGTGQIEIQTRGDVVRSECTLRWGDDSKVSVEFPEGESSDAWRQRCFELLTGARLALVQSPVLLAATTKERRRVPAKPGRSVPPLPKEYDVPIPLQDRIDHVAVQTAIGTWASRSALGSYFSCKPSQRRKLLVDSVPQIPIVLPAKFITVVERCDVIPDENVLRCVFVVRLRDRGNTRHEYAIEVPRPT